MAATEFIAGTFDKSTNTSTPVDQSVTGLGFQPKGIVFFATQDTTDDSIGPDLDITIGASDGTTERSISVNDEDQIGTSDNYRYANTGKVITITNRANGAILAVADLKTFDSDGFTLTWTTNNSTAYKINYFAIGGSNITDVEVGTITQPTTDGSQAGIGTIANANFLMVFSHVNPTEDSSVSSCFCQFGFAASTTQRGSTCIASADAAATSNTARYQVTDRVIAVTNAGGTAGVEADFDGFTASGFDLDWSNTDATQRVFYYMLVKGGTWEVGSGNTATSTGNQSYTTSFKPAGVVMSSVSASAPDPPASGASLFIGACDAANEAVIVGTSEDNRSSNQNTKSYTSISHCLANVRNGTDTHLDRASLSSFGSTDFTLNYDTADATARQFIWAAVEEDGGVASSVVILRRRIEGHA